MQLSEPTKLVNPLSDAASSDPGWLAEVARSPVLMLLVTGGLLVIYGLFVFRRKRRLDPRELAFRTIAHQRGYSRKQISTLRKHAMGAGMASPVGIVMSDELSARVLQSN
tara:strand:- start:171293 stop:171622 length:330 start_codon:yes stop_codon:yes gene_type:complete